MLYTSGWSWKVCTSGELWLVSLRGQVVQEDRDRGISAGWPGPSLSSSLNRCCWCFVARDRCPIVAASPCVRVGVT